MQSLRDGIPADSLEPTLDFAAESDGLEHVGDQLIEAGQQIVSADGWKWGRR